MASKDSHKESTKEALRKVEQMLADIGAPSPAAATGQQNAARAASRSVLSHAAAAKDCLAADAKANSPTVHLSQSRRSLSPQQSQQRGAHMAGKDRAEKRYYGQGFNLPPAESPGPIYAASPGFAEESVMASQMNKGSAAPGCAFTRASRYSGDRTASCTPGPNIYQLPPSVGRQSNSSYSNASTAVFTRAKRFNPKEFISRAHSKNSTSTDSPAPGAYDPELSSFKDGPSIVFTGAKCSKQFISSAHVVDSLGDASPGPVYSIDQSMKAVSKFKSSPAYTFGGTDRGTPDPADDIGTEDIAQSSNRCHVEMVNGRATRTCVCKTTNPRGICRHTKAQPFISSAHSKVMGSSDTPGPAFYSPDASVTHKRAGSAVFVRDREQAKVFVSRELSTQIGLTSPGPIYNTNTDALDKHRPAAVFAPLKSVPPGDRFTTKVFLGPQMGSNMGVVSPGPIYDPAPLEHGPSYTIVHKEKVPAKGVFPGPQRVRWVSQELASENLGAYSPGPKYDTRTEFLKNDGPKFSFGVSDRAYGDHFTEAQKAKFGTAEHPSTCPAESRFVSRVMSNITMAGKASPGPQNPNVNPSDAFSSKHKAVQGVKLPPQQSTKSRKELVAAASGPEVPPPLIYPNYEFGKPEAPAVSMPKAARAVGGPAGGGSSPRSGSPHHSKEASGGGAAASSSSVASYDVKYHLVEKSSPAVSFGGMF